MSFKVSKIDFEDAKNLISEYTYALIYELSNITLCKMDANININWNEVTEARFFNNNSELHLIGDEIKSAVIIKDADDKHTLIKEYALSGRFQSVGKTINVKQYLKPDEDGQMVVSVTRLAGIN